MNLQEYIEQLDKRIETMILKKEKYLSKRLYALALPVLIFLLGKTFTTINIIYLTSISLGYGIVSSIYNYFKYQYCRGIILSDTMKKLEIEMLDNANNLDKYFDNVKKKQNDVKNSLVGYSETFDLELKTLLFCLLLAIINMTSNLIFFKMFGIAFAVGCLNDYLNVMDCFRKKLKLADEESIIGIFLEENKGVVEISNILAETIVIDDNERTVNLGDYYFKINSVDDEYNITEMHVEEISDEYYDALVDKDNVKVRKLTRKNNTSEK